MNFLSSDRLVYKPLGLDHCTDEYVSWLNNPSVYIYLETGGNYTIDLLKEYLTAVSRNKEMLFWAIHLKENDKHIGNIKIDPVNKRHGLGEYGIMMGDDSEWGKGYAHEASKTIIDYCFTNIKLRKITLGVVEDNLAAVKLYQKLGFEVEGIYKDHGFYDGKLANIVRMAIFSDVYERK